MHAPVRFMTPRLVDRVKPPLPAVVRVGMGVWLFHTLAVGRSKAEGLLGFFTCQLKSICGGGTW